jgi:L-iditol 2-dehydrogenase
VVGVFGDRSTLDMGVVRDRELRLIGTLLYRTPDRSEAVGLVGANEVRLEPLVTDRFPFDRYLDAHHHIEANREKSMKVMIAIDA